MVACDGKIVTAWPGTIVADAKRIGDVHVAAHARAAGTWS